MTAYDCDRGRARLYMQRCNMEIVKAAAVARQGASLVAGARAPAGMGQTAKQLEVLRERRVGDGEALVTPLGHLTAVRVVPRVLAVLDRNDPRRQAAEMLGVAFERIGAVQGAAIGGNDTKRNNSDGGVTTRVKHAARLRLIEAAANLWPVDRRHGHVFKGRELVVMQVERKCGGRKEIRAFPLLLAICVDGMDLADILRAHGWSVQSKYTRPLGIAVLHLLGKIADNVGIDGEGGLRRS